MIDLSNHLHALNSAFSEVEQGLFREISNQKIEVQDLKHEVQSLQSANSRLTELLGVRDQENAKLTADLKARTEEETRLHQEFHLVKLDHDEADDRISRLTEDFAVANRSYAERFDAMLIQSETLRLALTEVCRRQDDAHQTLMAATQHERSKLDAFRADAERMEQRYQSQLDAATKENRELREQTLSQLTQHSGECAAFESEIERLRLVNQELKNANDRWKADADNQRLHATTLAQKLRTERKMFLDLMPEMEQGLAAVCRTPTDQLHAMDLLSRVFAEALDRSLFDQVAGETHNDGNILR